MKRILLFTMLFICYALFATGNIEEPSIREVDIIEKGIYEVVDGTPSLIESTSNIPLEIGTIFSIFYEVKGVSKDFRISINCIISGPNNIMHNWTEEIRLNRKQNIGYKLERSEELTRGVWTFIIKHKEEIILSEKFTTINIDE